MDREPGELFAHPLQPDLMRVLESAARLQQLVPEAVLVGGSASAAYAGHRVSLDHDHVLRDLGLRYAAVLGALESQADWRLARHLDGRVILGSFGDIEAGVRQLRRHRPLEVRTEVLPSGAALTVPTPEEALRVKAYLVTVRNTARDYLDTAALADWYGVPAAANVLADIDSYYTDPAASADRPLAAQLVRLLHVSRPRDPNDLERLSSFRELAPRWRSWDEVRRVNREVASEMLEE